MRRLIALALALTSCSPSAPTIEVEEGSRSSPTSATRSPGRFFLAVKGDWGAATQAQREVTARMCDVRARNRFEVVITTGDNLYPSGKATGANYYGPERCLIRFPGHRWRGSWGNHDWGGDTGRVLRSRRTYAWSAGGVDLFALDSNRAGDRAQREWLRRRLAGSRARVKIAYLHHSPFTVGSRYRDDERVKREWVPLFERYRVTLVLSGHSHLYEHHVVRGLHYVVTGGGGAPLYRCARRSAPLRRCAAEYHFLLVRVEGTAVTVRAIASSGRTIDRFTIGP